MSRNYAQDSLYKIGLDPNNMASLRNLGIAAPDQVTYQPASVYTVRSDFSRVGDGFKAVNWIWDVISIENLSKLLKFLAGQDYAAVYIRTDMRDGTIISPANAFRVFSATMWKPLLSGQEGTPIVKSPYAMQTVKLQFVNLVEMSAEYYL